MTVLKQTVVKTIAGDDMERPEYVLVSTAKLGGDPRSEIAVMLDGIMGMDTSGMIETMVFACTAEGRVDSYIDLDMVRNRTEDFEPQHAAMVTKWGTEVKP